MFFSSLCCCPMWTSWSRQVEVCLIVALAAAGRGDGGSTYQSPDVDVGEQIEGEWKKVEGGRKQPFYRDYLKGTHNWIGGAAGDWGRSFVICEPLVFINIHWSRHQKNVLIRHNRQILTDWLDSKNDEYPSFVQAKYIDRLPAPFWKKISGPNNWKQVYFNAFLDRSH